MEIFLILATIVGGVVGVIQLYKWYRPENLSASRKNNRKKITIPLNANKKGSFDFNEDEIKRISNELLFLLRKNESVEINYDILQHAEAREEYKKLSKQKKLSKEDLEKRNQLQKYFNSLETKLDKLSKIIKSVYSNADSLYATYGDDSFSEILIGILERFKQSVLVTGTKIDVWIEKDKRFTTAIYLSPKEMAEAISHLKIKSSQELAFGPNNYLVLDLPMSLILRKIIPEIAFHFMWLADREEKEIEQYSDNYNLLEWCIGLG